MSIIKLVENERFKNSLLYHGSQATLQSANHHIYNVNSCGGIVPIQALVALAGHEIRKSLTIPKPIRIWRAREYMEFRAWSVAEMSDGFDDTDHSLPEDGLNDCNQLDKWWRCVF
ncbi:hypothetical protein C0989_011179 [Termitomyces sp. Mn162]|nr:hypothetical protein C0989_011179 [Termitomyces sp. Mn162]